MKLEAHYNSTYLHAICKPEGDEISANETKNKILI